MHKHFIPPTISEYSEIVRHIKQTTDDVYYGIKESEQALDDAAVKPQH